MLRLRPGDHFGDYVLDRKLGLGGMAEVWLARPLTEDPRHPYVVLKRMHSHLSNDERLLAMFLDEARLSAKLNHPNIVRVLDSGQNDEDWFIVMELIDGLDLRACLEMHGGPLLPALAAALIADACAGLHYAHTLTKVTGEPLNIVHRDVAPDNLMVDVDGRVRLVDFGIARADFSEVTTQTGLRKGKARYMSPEYLLDHEATPKSDVYAMAATLWELVTGSKPYGDLSAPPSVIDSIVRFGLPRADTVRPSLPAPLVEIIAAASAHDAKKRLKSARALEERLREFLDEYRPPARAEIGAEVAIWKKKTGGALKLPKRVAGTFGQLESTEMIPAIMREPVTDKMRAVKPMPPAVQVAHQLEDTDWQLPAPVRDEETDRSIIPPEREKSVELAPELEALAKRSASGKRKKKRSK